MLHIYNSLTRKKTAFTPLIPGKIGIYICGMTVYDYCHIGHARVLVAFDVIVRHLKRSGFDVTYVRNITDIDDKIIARAVQNHETCETLTARFIEAMNEDAEKLGILPPDKEPKATEYVEPIIRMVSDLIDKEYAYCADNGDVYYRVTRFDHYGKLSGKVLADLQSGARVEVNSHKENPLDFVLWKGAKPDEPSWLSPWGAGRPGWHIECSAMSKGCLGDTFDIHGGGPDLKFPHHENEIAQSEAANGCTFANTWMHAGAVRVDNEKMSKSLGNFFTIREVLAKYPAEVVRFFLLSSHYRSPINYSEEGLKEAEAGLQRLYTALNGLTLAESTDSSPYDVTFNQVMDDDFNTPKAVALLFEMAREINKLRLTDIPEASRLALVMRTLAGYLGILQQTPRAFLQGDNPYDDTAIQHKIEERIAAKKAGDFALADTIREQLAAQGIILQDGREGTTWRIERP